MTTLTLADTVLDVDAEGFLQKPEQWTEAIAAEIARGAGIDPLTDRHWQVVRFMRDDLPHDRHRAHDPHARQGLRRAHQGALPALPQGPGEARREDRRHPQAARLHLERTPAMTQIIDQPLTAPPKSIEKVSIVISKGSLEGIYPGLIMANGARMEGIDANVFFTFFGLDAIRKDRQAKIKVATVGNPGMHIPTLVGGLPGMSALATRMMKRQMEQLDIPPIPEFVELISDSGAGLYACKATVDMFKLDRGRTSSSRSTACSPSASSTSSPRAARSSSPDARPKRVTLTRDPPRRLGVSVGAIVSRRRRGDERQAPRDEHCRAFAGGEEGRGRPPGECVARLARGVPGTSANSSPRSAVAASFAANTTRRRGSTSKVGWTSCVLRWSSGRKDMLIASELTPWPRARSGDRTRTLAARRASATPPGAGSRAERRLPTTSTPHSRSATSTAMGLRTSRPASRSRTLAARWMQARKTYSAAPHRASASAATNAGRRPVTRSKARRRRSTASAQR